MRTTNEIMQDFGNLASRLSPENLCCDGELSRNQVNQRLAQIKREWKALEKELGRKVTEDEVFEYSMEQYKKRRG